MAVTLVDVENSMVSAFLANADVAAKISTRFYKIACQEWILSLESFLQERSPRTGQWADYRRAGQTVNRLKHGSSGSGGSASKLRFAAFELRTFGQVVEDAEALQELFLAVIGDGFAGTWGTNPAVTVKNAHWDYESQSSDYEETFKQAYASIGLIVPYRTA